MKHKVNLKSNQRKKGFLIEVKDNGDDGIRDQCLIKWENRVNQG